MESNFDKVKAHVKKHKTVYACTATAIVTAGITCIIMKGRHAELQSGSGTAENSVFMRPFNFFSNHNHNTVSIVTVIERENRGHPGYIVHCLETGELFTSQKQAAAAQNVSDAILSLHLRGKLPDVNGLHFERVGIAA